MDYQVIIIGGGASALMLASLLPRHTALLIDANPKAGEKIRISGGGKCNITNARMGSVFYLGEKRFIEPVLKRFDEKKLLQWLERRGLHPKLRKESQYFCPHTSQELLDILLKESQKQKMLLNEQVLSVRKHEETFPAFGSQWYRV